MKYNEEFSADGECLSATFTIKKDASDTFTPSTFPEYLACQREIGSNIAEETVTLVHSCRRTSLRVRMTFLYRPGKSQKNASLRDCCRAPEEIESTDWEFESIGS